MRIISKFKDYYDIGQSLGIDPSIVYVRNTVDLTHPFNIYNHYGDLRWAVIGFCGKIYPVVYHSKNIGVGVESKTISIISYNEQEVLSYCRQNGIDTYIQTLEGNRDWTDKRSGVEKFFDTTPNCFLANFPDLFHTNSVAIFIVLPYQNKIVLNPLLRSWHFYKVFDSYRAFQELSMYVGGILSTPIKPVLVPTDDIMRDIKGFDRFSFRKDKSNR